MRRRTFIIAASAVQIDLSHCGCLRVRKTKRAAADFLGCWIHEPET